MSIKCDIDSCDNDAVVHCPDCEQNYCEQCNKDAHKSKKTKDHQRNPISIPKPKCDIDECGNDAVVHCPDCEQNYCEQCDKDVHKSKKTKDHQRNPIGTRPKSPSPKKAKTPVKTPPKKVKSPKTSPKKAKSPKTSPKKAKTPKTSPKKAKSPEWVAIFDKNNQIVFAKVSDVKSDVDKFYRVMNDIKNDAKLADLNKGDNKIPILGLKTFLGEYGQAKELLKKIGIKLTTENKQEKPDMEKNEMLGKYPLGVIIVENEPVNLNDHRQYIVAIADAFEDIGSESSESSESEQKDEESIYIRREAERYVNDIVKDMELTEENLKQIKKDLKKKGIKVSKLEGSKQEIMLKLYDAVQDYIMTEYLRKLTDGKDCDLDKPCGEDEECDLRRKKCVTKTEFNYYEGMEREKYNKNHFVGTRDDIERLRSLKKSEKAKKAEKEAKKAEKEAEKAKKEEREAEKEDELIEFSIGIEGDEKMDELEKQFLKCLGLIQ